MRAGAIPGGGETCGGGQRGRVGYIYIYIYIYSRNRLPLLYGLRVGRRAGSRGDGYPAPGSDRAVVLGARRTSRLANSRKRLLVSIRAYNRVSQRKPLVPLNSKAPCGISAADTAGRVVPVGFSPRAFRPLLRFALREFVAVRWVVHDRRRPFDPEPLPLRAASLDLVDTTAPLIERRAGGRVVVPGYHLLRLGDGRFDVGRRFMHSLVWQIRRQRGRRLK